MSGTPRRRVPLPMSETLRLAIRAVGSPLAKKRLEPVLHQVRQGEALSAALERVRGFPSAISRLAAVGEATGSLGQMLTRAGRLEEEAAIRRIEQVQDESFRITECPDSPPT